MHMRDRPVPRPSSTTCTSKARGRCATTCRSSPRCASQWSGPASSEARSDSRWPGAVTRSSASTATAHASPAPRSSARSSDSASSFDDAVRGADLVVVAVPVGASRRRSWCAALDAGAPDRHRRRLGEGPGRRARSKPSGRKPRRASSAATRWRVRSRKASTAPTPTCSWARPGCSRRPRPPTPSVFTRVARAAARARRRGRVGDARASRRARRAREPRAAARGDHADGRRDRPRGGAPHAAAPRGRRVPRHDAHRRRPPGHLARHLRRQPRRDARRARRVPRRAAARIATSSPHADRDGLLGLLERARAARRNLPVGRVGERRPRRAAHPGARPRRASSPRSRRSPAARREHRRLRDRALARGRRRCARARRRGRRCRRVRGRAARRSATTRAGRCCREHLGALSDELAFGGVRPLRGRVRVPGDKSISHRALLFAAIADGAARSRTSRRATTSTRRSTAVQQLGVKVRSRDGGHDRPRHGSRRVARGRRRARLRQLRHDDARASPASSPDDRSSRCSPATRRCGPGRWGASSSRCARWARRSTAAPTGRAHRSRSGAVRCTACGTSCRSRRRR